MDDLAHELFGIGKAAMKAQQYEAMEGMPVDPPYTEAELEEMNRRDLRLQAERSRREAEIKEEVYNEGRIHRPPLINYKE